MAAPCLALVALAASADVPAPAHTELTARQRNMLIGRSLRKNCAVAWPRNEKLQKECLDAQFAAGQELETLGSSFAATSEERMLVIRCFERWVQPQKRRVDFRMALQCAQFEIDTLQLRK